MSKVFIINTNEVRRTETHILDVHLRINKLKASIKMDLNNIKSLADEFDMFKNESEFK